MSLKFIPRQEKNRAVKMGRPARPDPPQVGHLVDQPNPTHL